MCRERFEKKRTSNFTVFAREINEIRNEDYFYLERTDFGKEIDTSVNSSEDLLFFFFLENSFCCGEIEKIRAKNCGESVFPLFFKNPEF